MSHSNEPIAIIGSGCRFPGDSSSPSKLWDLLKDPRDVSRKIDRFEAEAFYHENGHHHGTSNVLHSYLLNEDTRAFDAQFFSIPGGEASTIDPQQRFLMEVIYEGLESAGQKIEDLSGSSTGVYVGVMCNDFAQVTYADIQNVPKYAATGTALSILSNRVSYFFNWTGPSMTIDTACSSSLIAVHQAVQLLRSGQSRVAVAAGTNLIFTPTNYIAESNVNMLSPTGRSRMWDSNADGYARGEGVGCVILKLLKDAIADGDVIESVIRETGTNQDGRTTGITMPSSKSQAALIRETYNRAGLDPLSETDRCQYFEAHGTGTKAGDPQEASAIHQAFYPAGGPSKEDDILYVGSIKTVIGHTEGTAGIAGLLKASLSVQHGIIPANMLFTDLNPDVEPYYGFLQIPTSARPWPALPPGVPRRASVNSFGFGGANAHAIVENYVPAEEQSIARNSSASVPFVFSANSEKALTSQIKAIRSFVNRVDDSVNARDVAWTLSRKSCFSHRASFAAATLPALAEKLSKALESKEADDKDVGLRFNPKKQKILGIFTGQGAQWPTMGYALIQSSPAALATIQALEESLQSLPKKDRPSWSIQEELSKAPEVSSVMQAEFSQPLCTAVQIVLVDLLRASGIEFSAVVGHSSGEIGAAYASGFLTASDAIRVAYYRGVLGSLANADGAMLAAGTSMEDATELCRLPVFRDRITVAASNSPASVTLSGDRKAIERAQLILEDESKFARMLKVDKAYHSHHMAPCAEPYMQAMSQAKVQIQEPSFTCRWFSSVLGGPEVTTEMADQLSGAYWRDNLINPVLFSQALEAALEAIGEPAVVVEVGPHPALKGPASLVIGDKFKSDVSYTGVLARNINDVEALSEGIGAIWKNIDSSILSFANLDALFSDVQDKPMFLKQVPNYAWDHDRTYWNESRATKSMYQRTERHHELLGVRLDGGEHDFRWRNFIKPSEMPWLRGHQVQGQMVFPGAGFASMAFEACKALAPLEQISMIELIDLRVSRAMALTDESPGVESLVTLSNVQRDGKNGVIFCDYECSICPTPDSVPVRASTGSIRLELGTVSLESLPSRNALGLDMNNVDMDHFYNSLAALGYNYSDMFTGISSLKRTTDTASGIIHIDGAEGYDPAFIFHPAPLDVAFQSIFGALGAPGDGRLWTVLVPTLISRIRVNPHACRNAGLGMDMPFDSVISVTPSNGVSGDVDICDQDGNTLVQVERLHVSPLTATTEQDDRHMFSSTEWTPFYPDATKDFSKWVLSEEEHGHMVFIERACFLYMKRVHDVLTQEERENCDWHRKKYLAWVAEIVGEVAEGRHPTVSKECMNDTWEEMKDELEDFCSLYPDFRLLIVVGDNLVGWMRGEVDFLEMYRETGMLEHIYKNTYGFPEYNAYLGKLVRQLSQRFRQMDILEIGAGTGSATEAIMSRIGDSYASYSYTDISAGFFLEAKDIFNKQGDKFAYTTFDVEKDPIAQGYAEHSYDLVVASNVLHATKSLETTLTNARKLLKPGGYLVILEITDTDPLRPTFFFGTLSGWWVGETDGRPHHPLLTQAKWDAVLRKSGFSGLDTATPPSGEFMVPQSIMLSQAVDTQMNLIRQPFSPKSNVQLDDLLVLGGQSMSSFQLQEDIIALLQPIAKNITFVENLDLLEESHFTSKQITLSLLELDEPVFNPFTPAKWAGLQLFSEKAQNVLWITQGGSGEHPYANMMIGVARCLTCEKPDLRFQTIDFDAIDSLNPQMIAEAVLRLHISDTWGSFVEAYDTAWLLEREIRVIGGEMTVPRYIPNKVLDGRYNSSRRTVQKDTNLNGSVIAISAGEASYELQQVVTPEWEAFTNSGLAEIKVERSSLATVSLGSFGSLFLTIGKLSGSGEKVLAFSDLNASVVSVPKAWAIAYNGTGEEDLGVLKAAFDVSLAQTLITAITPSSALLVYEPTAELAEALKEIAADQGKNVTCTTSRTEIANKDILYIHPSTHARALASIFPKRLTAFVDLSGRGHTGSLAPRIEKQLPIQCRRLDVADLIGRQAFTRPSGNEDTVVNVLKRTLSYAIAHPSSSAEEFPVGDMTGQTLANFDARVKVLNWTTSETLPVNLSPPEDVIQFRSDKTYWLVGLAGQLGLSICQWMVKRGARHVALSSRTPKISEKWLKFVQADGAEVRAVPCDVTDRRSVMRAHKAICDTMPPIAGVANGAMILNDGIIAQQPHDMFNQTLKPKVDGTRFLNDIFSKPTLDFFVVFSSLAYVTGNIGQSSYAAANAFMASVVEGRRKRGLAGSVMNLAGIFGIGYITRTDRGIIERLGKMGYSNVSEWDFLQFFAESVNAGHPNVGSGHDHEISSSLRPYDPSRDENPPAWLNIPRFCYYKRSTALSSAQEDGKNESVRSQLKEQKTKDDVYKVLLAGLTAVLYKNLGLRPEDNNIAPHTRLIELGIDSLVAVDMRFWFTKELDLDMPVLKLLGGASVEEMVQDTMERLSPELTPNWVKEPAEAEASTGEEEVPTIVIPDDDSTSNGSPLSVSENETPDSEATTPPASRSLSEAGYPKEGLSTPPLDLELELAFERKVKMSYPSLQFWFLIQHLGQDAPHAFNVSFRVALKGRMDISRMEEAVKSLGERHDALRTAFFDDSENDYEPTQGVLSLDNSPLRLEVQKIASLQEAIDFNEKLDHYVFDIQRGRTIRMAMLSESDTAHYLILGFHHIAMDGFSFDVFLRELGALYEGKALPPVTIQWNDLMEEQRLGVGNGLFKAETDYWRSTLATIPDPIPMLPMARSQTRVSVTKFAFEECPITVLDEKTVRGIRERCREMKVTRYHFFLSILRIMLFELTDVEELCIGTVDANRGDSRASSTIGLMVNVLPMKFQRSTNKSFTQLTQEGRDQAYAALANSRLPFKAMLDQLAVPRSTQCSPIFQVVLDYLPHKIETPEGLGAPGDEVKATLNYSLADMVIDVNDISSTEIRLRWRGQTSLYSERAVKLMLDMFTELVKKYAVADPKLLVDGSKLTLYNSAQVQAATGIALGSSMVSQWGPTVSHVIDENSVTHPDTPALKDGLGNSLTYSQASKRVNQIANALLESGIEHRRVAGYQEPTADWVCSLLAVWKIGAAYVPLDSRQPTARIAVMLAGCNPSAVVCHQETVDNLTGINGDAIVINISDLPSMSTTVESLATKAKPEQPALLIFTSGSTGTPKAVEVRHSSLKNIIEGVTATYGFDQARQTVLQHSAHSFDICFGQILLGLCNRGSVFVAPKDKRADPLELCKIVRDEKITIVMSTPGEYSQWLRFGRSELQAADSWKFGFSGGEAMHGSLKAAFNDLGMDVTLINAYGPAETIILSTTKVVDYKNETSDYSEAVSIGKPIPNSGVFIVDRNMKPVPSGVTGEIVITGAGVANGYYGQSELTKATFIRDTLTPSGYSANYGGGVMAKMYRTGDSGRYDENGELHFEGRIAGDSQVKLNGIRIEIKEIESVIVKTSAGVLHDTIVSVRRNPDFLVAHVEFAQPLEQAEQKSFLSSLLARLPLPKYMSPALLVPIDAIPLTPHGKADRKAVQALPLPTRDDDGNEQSLTETERALKNLWIEALPEECTLAVAIKPETEFFNLGGGSYLLVLIQGLIRKRFHVLIPVMKLFDASSLRDMASKIDAAAAIAAVDWEAEIALEEGLKAGTNTPNRKPSSGEGLIVVLTGATGYLGKRLLRELIENKAVSRVHCVAFRGTDKDSVLEPVPEDFRSRVEVHSGDLASPLLGLEAETFNALALEADVIIHSGANRSFWDYYQSLRGPNVVSTKTLVKMAAIGSTPVHFISSGGLIQPGLDAESSPASITDIGAPPIDGSNGYIASKWASEAYLERAGRELGLPVYIHRVTRAPAQDDTSPTALPEGLISDFLDLTFKLKAVPQPQGWRGSFDLLRTSELSHQLVDSFIQSSADPTNDSERVQYVHYPSTVRLQMENVVEGLQAAKQVANGDDVEGFETLPPHVWVGKAKKVGLDWHFAGQDFSAFGAEGVSLRR
ncbi:putative Hybrid PKS-NRPS biosynthetic cluster [Pseudogymnoascus verrucosus]|uniref:Putative Hybrid PKS-NRPS biosynthetic cluster n=1 Tax=Pseudogymnoascus verrucosus TaxID=342668 RepID=A0A1B8GYF7_9PEZI|nr:putative Hybrid PKS-NRPS biosynthetic cluster [Pseudogymnoascus verrucosus]OBU00869.1 putative Hybrid PKS-NRPS biosynthetic cluster [Pseudogymnoascus verrucosus]